ncbi:hypothetical protein [Mesorhizobium sp.]|uniref:hypothetical protein n=1 Tax=Mesorhizobium sp. TaxID=1871066 RepID=UPI000FE86BBD|nr:hypothetical protein [Mesorhizobium sp.]RWB66486.1 MAG: hypothetical protein EOQ49_28625 [Mesorhizobium sp.]RWB90720.1 MAG: hypothetical protein EOQ52_08875 [Mesorhizobium sp.]
MAASSPFTHWWQIKRGTHAADRSFFSPSGAVEPALTIAAHTVRIGDRLTSILVHQEPVQ